VIYTIRTYGPTQSMGLCSSVVQSDNLFQVPTVRMVWNAPIETCVPESFIFLKTIGGRSPTTFHSKGQQRLQVYNARG
jgi:hypothetical protein